MTITDMTSAEIKDAVKVGLYWSWAGIELKQVLTWEHDVRDAVFHLFVLPCVENGNESNPQPFL